ncbi:GDSL-type esterase/lipase family protein [Paenibacillus aestuarii]|uniref:GDSL-type esterase/lipase family protein n=1 Tax=Paenibacillus aestuarii TaxID=516965 RepID=A0ABW0KHR5_9BACL|nr:GDSL-type esterase/lipase family protein [Paenibacillus aestuarii]
MEKTINYLAFGDSLTVGFGDPTGLGFVVLYQQWVAQLLHVPVTLQHAGTNGATTTELLNQLETDANLQAKVRDADVITITAGGNDLIQAAIPFFFENDSQYLKTALQVYEANYRKLVEVIDHLHQGSAKPYVMALIGLYNPLPQVPDSAYWVQRFNLILRKLEQPHIIHVQVYDAFIDKDDSYLADDYIHPNEQGYEAVARQVERTVPVQRLQDLII